MRSSFALALVVGCGGVEPDGTTYGPPPTLSGVLSEEGSEGTASTGTGSSGTSSSSSSSESAADTTTGVCVVGSEGCPSTEGGGCDPALACLSHVCVDPGPLCPVGSQGCPCTLAMTCEAGLACDSNHCVPAG